MFPGEIHRIFLAAFELSLVQMTCNSIASAAGGRLDILDISVLTVWPDLEERPTPGLLDAGLLWPPRAWSWHFAVSSRRQWSTWLAGWIAHEIPALADKNITA